MNLVELPTYPKPTTRSIGSPSHPTLNKVQNFTYLDSYNYDI